MSPSEQMLDRSLSPEQLYRLREDLRRVQEPFIQLLVDLYAVSLPRITIADGLVETTYSPEVEKQASEIRREMARAMEMVSRYKPELCNVQESEMSEIRVDALEAAVREFNLTLPAWAPFKRWGDLTLQERDQCLTRAVEIMKAINVLKKWVAA